jgi:hypothetical protein
MKYVKFIREDSGNFRHYYREVDGLRKRLFCTQPAEMLTLPQWRAQGEPLDWYECSRDGEPSHRVNNIEVMR